ncbi:aminoacyl tRNA synthase complex-interacting multifunctional protein 1-like [Mizuhopecten yessoensis]|uniref:Aminoacyl tRNA synthase complex-interacting multifunctional protein 1 n=1 Tax=Mizuhopecten yessoensis TaxID=6573 RepID=A0A210PXT4_MIZYE|nr:aminoacyl tRNA synthase complex-interacting multifunctional protein 1-like [Mizuhopecten yessoensis]OWF41308.1 Aminoacyl tRNA synthase complex-interacting multifunctional protein 1 [Mizuhopecten yessoensis]
MSLFGSIRMASASVLRRLTQRADEAEKIITELKATIELLKDKAAVVESKPEEKRLQQDNAKLRKEIDALKIQLVLSEVRNGVTQVALPSQAVVAQCVDKAKANAQPSAPTADKKAEVLEQSEKVKDNKKSNKKGKEAANSGEAKSKKGKAATSGPAEPEKMDISRLDLRVGKIVEVEKHPDADTLYIEKVDVGEEQPRTVVSGLVKHVTLEEMQNRVAVFMLNLKPAKMRGVLSQAMIMCASSPEKVEILNVPQGAQIGDKVVAEGYSGEPDAILNPKKKVWEALKPDLRTNGDRVATWKGAPLKIEGKGQIVAPTLGDVQIQ